MRKTFRRPRRFRTTAAVIAYRKETNSKAAEGFIAAAKRAK